MLNGTYTALGSFIAAAAVTILAVILLSLRRLWSENTNAQDDSNLISSRIDDNNVLSSWIDVKSSDFPDDNQCDKAIEMREMFKGCKARYTNGLEVRRDLMIDDKVVGLKNLGASCYVNAFIQCMRHLPGALEDFLKNPLINPKIRDSVQSIMQKMDNAPNLSYVDIRDEINQIRAYHKEFYIPGKMSDSLSLVEKYFTDDTCMFVCPDDAELSKNGLSKGILTCTAQGAITGNIPDRMRLRIQKDGSLDGINEAIKVRRRGQDYIYDIYGIEMAKPNCHYVSLVKGQRSKEWYYINDSCVQQVGGYNEMCKQVERLRGGGFRPLLIHIAKRAVD